MAPANIESIPMIYPPIIVLEKIFNDSLLKIELSNFASLYVVRIIKSPIIISAYSIKNHSLSLYFLNRVFVYIITYLVNR